MKFSFLPFAGLLGLFGTAFTRISASAQVMLSPVAAIGDHVTTYNETVPVARIVDQSGIENPFVSGVTLFATYFANPSQMFATSGNGGVHNWQSEVAFELGYQGYVDFDLGAVYRIDKLAIWNRSVKDVTVKVLNDRNGPEQVIGDFALTNKQSFTFSYTAEILPFPATYEGRFVRLVINTVHAIQGFNFGYASLGEVVVSAALPTVPVDPTLDVIYEANGDVTLVFSGTLQSASSLDGTFADVPGNPQGTYTVAKANLMTQQFFLARGN